MRLRDRQIPEAEFALPTWSLSPSIQDHMVREEAKSLTPKQCAVVELALDTIKVRGPTAAHPRVLIHSIYKHSLMTLPYQFQAG